MLRALFEAVEKHFGASLEGAATFAWTLGLALVALQVLAPFARVAVELALFRAGVEQGWWLACPACTVRAPLGESCPKCGSALPVPLVAKLFARSSSAGPTARRVKWALSLAGALAFLAGTFWLIGLSPSGPVERLFAGAALVSWAGVGVFLSRALGPRGGGPLARLRELFFAGAAGGLLATCVFLQSNVKPLPEQVLAHLTVGQGAVELDGAKLQLDGQQLGLELQVIEGLGMSRALPLSFVGQSRAPIELGTADAWLRDNTWKHAGALLDLGVQVKRRTETFPIFAGQKYELVLRERDVQLKPVK